MTIARLGVVSISADCGPAASQLEKLAASPSHQQQKPGRRWWLGGMYCRWHLRL